MYVLLLVVKRHGRLGLAKWCGSGHLVSECQGTNLELAKVNLPVNVNKLFCSLQPLCTIVALCNQLQ